MGSLAGAGTLGFLIPPSLIMIVYAILAEVSIGKMFMAGILPGLLLAGYLFKLILFTGAFKTPKLHPRTQENYTWAERLTALKDLAPTLLLILMVLGQYLRRVCHPHRGRGPGRFGCLGICIAQPADEL